ncbi:hypothetical protein ORI99_13550, partial [Alishewanella sp. SMS9]|nr:hypothetical protein [Alishewanella sp. SMS9]
IVLSCFHKKVYFSKNASSNLAEERRLCDNGIFWALKRFYKVKYFSFTLSCHTHRFLRVTRV